MDFSINYEPLYNFILEKRAHSTWYSRHREEAHRRQAVWAMMHREQIKRRASRRKKLLKQHMIISKTRKRVGNTYVTLGAKI